jgi:hypothetical protein
MNNLQILNKSSWSKSYDKICIDFRDTEIKF